MAMLIGELAKQTGLSKDTIRFYEKIGLIVASKRVAGTRFYRDYGPDMVERLAMISQGKTLGFTLGEMKALIVPWEAGEISPQDQITIVEHKLKEVAEKIDQLHTMQAYLVDKLDQLHAGISLVS
jgi:MerR family transcriptional regulator, copper efflux regulator